jgi:acetyltransferase-like isoleucine patch superfamily enzyme
MNVVIAKTAIVYPNVKIGENSVVQDNVILGYSSPGYEKEELVIGSGSLIRPHTIIYGGSKIGNNFKTGPLVVIREKNKIGNNVRVGTNTIIEDQTTIKDNVSMHTNVYVSQFTVLEEKVWIGPNVVLIDDPHPPCPKYSECVRGPIIRKNAKIGANATILPGVEIGANALVGAGSVVTKNVPANAVVAGNPAKVIKSVDELVCFKRFFNKPYAWEKTKKQR